MKIPESELHSCVARQLTHRAQGAILADIRLSVRLPRAVAEPRLLFDLIQLACSPVRQTQAAERVSQNA